MASYPMQRAAELGAEYHKNLERIRQDRELSDAGRARRIALLHHRHASEMRALREQHDRLLGEERQRLQRKAFGAPIPAGATPSERQAAEAGYRDALERAERAENEKDALRILDRAHRTGDPTMARAVAAIASERGWTHALSTYAGAFDAGVVSELAELESALADPQQKFAASMTFSTAGTPREIAGLPASTLTEFLRTPV